MKQNEIQGANKFLQIVPTDPANFLTPVRDKNDDDYSNYLSVKDIIIRRDLLEEEIKKWQEITPEENEKFIALRDKKETKEVDTQK
jgi:hypothetical protein